MSFTGRYVVSLSLDPPENDPYDDAVDQMLGDSKFIEILESFGFIIPNVDSTESLEQDEVYYSDRLTKKDCQFCVYIEDDTSLCIELSDKKNKRTLTETIEIPLCDTDEFYEELTSILEYMCETDDRDLTLADVLGGNHGS